MSDRKYLIVNADDFGLSHGINRGVIQAHERGIVTSASLMVRWPAAREAAEYGRTRSQLSVGLHVDLCEWTYAGEEWRIQYQVVPLEDRGAVAQEVERQLETFRALMGRDPTHLDSHQHVHNEEPVRSIMAGLAGRLGLVLRHIDPRVQYCGEFYGQSNKGYAYPAGISVESLEGTLRSLTTGVTELGCHPGLDEALDSMYLGERKVECETLCDPRVRKALVAEGIVLCSFSDRPTREGQTDKSSRPLSDPC